VASISNENQQKFWQDSRTFLYFYQTNKVREIPNFQEYQIKFWDQYTLKKADPET